MTPIWCLVQVAIILLLGYTVLCGVFGRQRLSLPQALGLAGALGAGALGVVLFWLSIAGLTPTRGVQIGIAGACLAALAGLWRWGRLISVNVVPEWKGSPRKDLWMLLPVAAVVYGTILVAITSLVFPLYEQDAFAIWALKAKVLTLEPLRDRPRFFYEGSLSYSHQDYPLLLPFLTAGTFGMIGEVNDRIGKLPCLVLYVSLGGMFFSFLRERLSRVASAALTAVLLLLPALLRWAGAGTADAPLTVFYAGSVFYAARWVRRERAQDAAMAALFTAFTAFTKNEGLGLAAIALLVTGAFSLALPRRRRLAGWAAFLGGTVLVLLPWLIWSRDLPRTHEDYGGRLTPSNLLAHADQLRIILPALGEQVTAWARWGPLWVLLLGAAALGWKAFGRRHVLALWLMGVLHVALYVCAYMVTPGGAKALIPGTLDRLLLHVTPAAVLLIGWHWEALCAREESASRPPRPSL